MLLFATLMVVFVIVTVNHFGEKQYVTDNVRGLPPVYVLTAILIPFCALFVAGFCMLFYDSFKRQATLEQVEPRAAVSMPLVQMPTRRERLADWARARRPHRPQWLRRAG